MGNSGFRKLLAPGDYVENKYFNVFQINAISIDKQEIPLEVFKGEVCLFVNTGSNNKDSDNQFNLLKQL